MKIPYFSLMSKNERVLKLVREWVDKIGPREARKRLVGCDFALATADKIVRGDYSSTPREENARKLLEEMAKDGVILDEGAA